MFSDIGRTVTVRTGARGIGRRVSAARRSAMASSKQLDGLGGSKSLSRNVMYGAGLVFASTVGYTLWAEHRRRVNAAKRARTQAAIAQAQAAAAASEAARQEALGRAIAFETQARRLEAEAIDLKARAEAAEKAAQNVPPEVVETAAAQASGASGGFSTVFAKVPTWAWIVGAGAAGLLILRR